MWAELAAFVQANTMESLLITIVGTLLVWLYKQFKDMIDRQQQEKEKEIRAKQGLLMRLELTLATALHQNQPGNIQQLNQLFGDCAPYLTSIQRSLLRDYYRTFDSGVLLTLHSTIVHEVDKLSQQQEKDAEDQDAVLLLYIRKLYDPVWPIILFAVLLMYIYFIYAVTKQGMTA